MTITELLQKKFYLAKYLRIPDIDNYTITVINNLWNIYLKYLDDNKNKDIDFPGYELKFK